PRPSFSKASATARRWCQSYGLGTTASAAPARWVSPLAARTGMCVVAGSSRRQRMSSTPSITGIAHFMPGPLEDPLEQKPLVRFVIDHQNPRHAALYPFEINYLA